MGKEIAGCRNLGGYPTAVTESCVSTGPQLVTAAEKFETGADSIEEDEARRQVLLNYMPIIKPVGWANIDFALRQAKAYVLGRRSPRLDRRRALSLIRKLDRSAENEPTSLASAVTMLNIRIEVIGALIDALAAFPDEKLCTVTIVKPAWVFTPEQLTNVSAHQIKHAFKEDLRRAGAYTIDGPSVGFLHGEFEPSHARERLFRLLTIGPARQRAGLLVSADFSSSKILKLRRTS